MPRLADNADQEAMEFSRGCGPPLRGFGRKEHQMLDLILLALGLGFFVLTIGYAHACDRL